MIVMQSQDSRSPSLDSRASAPVPDSRRQSSTSSDSRVVTAAGGSPLNQPGAVPPIWIEYNPNKRQRRRDIRVHAAKASADARKATIAQREAKKRQVVTSKASTLAAELWTRAQEQGIVAPESPLPVQLGSSSDTGPYRALFATLLRRQDAQTPPLHHMGEAMLQRQTIRTTLWNAMTGNSTLFQVALFVAGTHSNTCGIPRSALVHMGPGLVALRGASLDAIQAAVTVHSASVTPLAIALLAGWERRFGDGESYNVHMKAWKTLSLPATALDENNVAALTDLALELYREGLDQRAIIVSNDTALSSHPETSHLLASLPPGLRLFDLTRPESRSLMHLVSQFAHHDPYADDALARLRTAGLENLAWSPTHTASCAPRPLYEEDMDQLELSALYHTRAAIVSLGGMLFPLTMKTHNESWTFDMSGALHQHAVSCPHLRSEVLLGTKYERIALWSRFSVCAVAPDAAQEPFLRMLLWHFDVRTWEQMRVFLGEFFWAQEVCEEMFGEYFEGLMRGGRGVEGSGRGGSRRAVLTPRSVSPVLR